MKLSNPIKGYINKKAPNGSVTQWFGENPELYKAAINLKSHNGIDLVAPYGTPIYAIASGLVVECKDDASGYGKHVRILCDNEDKKGGYEMTYGHAAQNLVKIGERVETGQMIQLMGNTGFVVSDVNALGYWVKGSNKYAGTHLHLSIREFKYDKKGWRYYPNTPKITILNYNNGWNGCFDFAKMFYEDAKLGDVAINKWIKVDESNAWYKQLFNRLKDYYIGIR